MKRFAFWPAMGLLLSLLLLSGCAMNERSADALQEVNLPEPPQMAMEVPNEDTVPVRRIDAELFLRSADGAMLIPVSQRLSIDYTQDPAFVLLEALLTVEEEGLVNPIPEGTRVLNLEHSGRLVTVDLSIDAYGVESAHDLLLMEAAIAGTLGSLEDIEHVNLLIGGRKYAFRDMSMGALSVSDADMTLLWARANAEADLFFGGDGSYSLSRNAVVYYPAFTGGSFLPVVVPVSCTAGAAADALIAALTELPEGLQGVRAAFTFPPEYSINTVVTEDGRRVMKITFSEDTWAAIPQEDRGMTCAATALTLVSFLPEVDGVVFCAGDMLITQFELAGETVSPNTGVVTRELLRSRIGTAVDLYYAAEDHAGLKRVTRVLSTMVEHYPRMLLSMLMEGPGSADGAVSAFPDGVTVDDISGFMMRGNVMQVNLSANFYRLCQALDATEERRLVYSMVNTLCCLDGVEAVQFFVEGEQADVLCDSIYIRVPLMPDAGMAEFDDTDEENDV